MHFLFSTNQVGVTFVLQRNIPLSSVYNKGIMIGYVISINIFCPFFVTYVTFNTTWTVLSIQKENLSDMILFNH